MTKRVARGLRHVSDRMPGVRRARAGKGFTYFDARGRRVRGASALARFRAIVIPPAWTDVWICPSADGRAEIAAELGNTPTVCRNH